MSNKNRKKKISILLVMIAMSLGLIFLAPKGFFNPLRKAALIVVYPLEKTFSLLSYRIKNALQFLSSISDLRRENERLLRENNILVSKVAELRSEHQENEILRKELNLVPKDKYDFESSFIIGQDPEQRGTWIMLDKGARSGISEGMPVIASEGILIGRVGEANAVSARVDLLTNPVSLVNVVDIETGAKGIVKGEFGLGLVMDMVAQEEVIHSGDTLVTSGLGGDMPKGLLVGTVQEVRDTSDKLFQQAIVVPRVPYRNLDVAFIITGTK